MARGSSWRTSSRRGAGAHLRRGGAVEAEACQRRGPTVLEQSAAGAGPPGAQANNRQSSSGRQQTEARACCRGRLGPSGGCCQRSAPEAQAPARAINPKPGALPHARPITKVRHTLQLRTQHALHAPPIRRARAARASALLLATG